MSPSQCSKELLIHFDTDNMPAGRTVINIESSDAQRRERLYWLIVNDGNVDVCVKYSGFDSDIKFFSIIRAMAEVWRGIGSLHDEIAIGSIVLEGNLKLRKEFPGRLLLSHFAPIKSMRRVEILIG
jgi:hypothetical protein